tara:strand:+ start:155 stop:343 length:189 start_codon:yes stop_codon:yes gene_type:complete
MDIYNALKKVSTSEGWSATKELKVVCSYIQSLRKAAPPTQPSIWDSFSEFLESKCLSEKDYK